MLAPMHTRQRRDDRQGHRGAAPEPAHGDAELDGTCDSTGTRRRTVATDRIMGTMPSKLRRQIGQLLIAGFNGHQIPARASVAREGVQPGRRHPVRAQRRRARAGGRAVLRCGAARARSAGLGLGRSGRGPRRAAEGAVHGVAADGDARAQRRRAAGRAFRAGARARAQERRDHARLRAGAGHPHQPEEPGHRRSGARREGRGRRAPRRASSSGRCRRRGIAACGKHFPGHGDTSTDSHVELPLVEHPPDRLRAVEFLPFKAAIDAGVATIMTAHVLVPSLDERRPATLVPARRLRPAAGRAEVRRRHPQRRSRDEGGRRRVRGAGFRRSSPSRPAATAFSSAAAITTRRRRRSRRSSTRSKTIGCRSPASRTRSSASCARKSASSRRRWRHALPTGRALRDALGRDEHRAIAEEMARFL